MSRFQNLAAGLERRPERESVQKLHLRLVIIPSRNINLLSRKPDQFGEEVIWKEAQAVLMVQEWEHMALITVMPNPSAQSQKLPSLRLTLCFGKR